MKGSNYQYYMPEIPPYPTKAVQHPIQLLELQKESVGEYVIISPVCILATLGFFVCSRCI